MLSVPTRSVHMMCPIGSVDSVYYYIINIHTQLYVAKKTYKLSYNEKLKKPLLKLTFGCLCGVGVAVVLVAGLPTCEITGVLLF